MLQLALKPTNTEFGKSVHLCLSGEDLVVKRVQHSGYVDEVTLPLFNLADLMKHWLAEDLCDFCPKKVIEQKL